MTILQKLKLTAGAAALPSVVIASIGDLFSGVGGWLLPLGMGVVSLIVFLFFLLLGVPSFVKRITQQDQGTSGWWDGPLWSQLGIWVLFTFTTISLALGIASFQNRGQGGLVAANTDVGKEIQKLAGLTEQVVIAQDRTTTAVEKVANTVKRETSDDARKELVNLGIEWTQSNFLQALHKDDLRAARLFFLSGMRIKVPRKNSSEPNLLFIALDSSPDTHKLLVEFRQMIDQGACIPGRIYYDAEHLKRSLLIPSAEDAYINVCSSSEARKLMDDFMKPMKAELEEQESKNRTLKNDRSKCTARLRREWPLERVLTVADPAAIVPNQTIGDVPEEYLAADFFIARISGAVSSEEYERSVISACERFYGVQDVDTTDINFLSSLRAKLN